jgi:hypothetical protein
LPARVTKFATVSLALNHDENGGNDNQYEKNPHSGTLPFRAVRKLYEHGQNKKGRLHAYFDFVFPS